MNNNATNFIELGASQSYVIRNARYIAFKVDKVVTLSNGVASVTLLNGSIFTLIADSGNTFQELTVTTAAGAAVSIFYY